MSSFGPNSLGSLLSNPQLLSALYPNLNLSSLSQYYTAMQTAMEAPVQNISTQLQGMTAKSTAWQTISAAVTQVHSDFQSLAANTSWAQSQAVSSNTSVLTATAGTTALAGTYAIDVTAVGQPEILTGQSYYTSATSALNLAAQTVTINSTTIAITSTDTLNSLASKINAANAGVTASVINSGSNYYLTLSSTKDSAITGSGTDLFGSSSGINMNLAAPTQPAKAWSFTINGVTGTSTTATDTSSIPGVTLNLLATGSTTLQLTTSGSGIQTTLGQLATDYNSLQSTIAKYTAKGAVLAGDATAEGIMSAINQGLFALNSSQPVGYQSVTDLGLTLTLNQDKTTTLTFTPVTFASAYAANPHAAQTLLAGSGSGGVAGSLSNLTNSYVASGTGVIPGILASYQSEIQQLHQSATTEQTLITMRQAALGQQFYREINALLALQGQQSMMTRLMDQLSAQSTSSSSSSSPSGG